MTIEAIVQQSRDLLDVLPAEAVSRARKRHAQVEGFAVFPVYAPVEIIHAAGLMPVGMFGAGAQVEISRADSRFQSFICSIAKSTLELFLRGDLDEFRGAVFSSICDVARNLASVAKRNVPDMYIEYLHMPQRAHSPAAADYTRGEFRRFRRNLSRHLHREITDEALARSIALYNRVRRMTRQLYELRRRRVDSIAAAELATVCQAGTRMMPEDYLPLLEQMVEQVAARDVHPRDSVEVVIEGAFCEQPPIALLEVIEAAGCRVRDDDLAIGWRLFTEDVSAADDPLAALADAYLRSSVYTSVRHDGERPRTEGLLIRMQEAGAQAVLFTPAKFCEPALLDYVLFRGTLDKCGLPHLKLEFEEKMWTFENSRNEVETFAESMLFD